MLYKLLSSRLHFSIVFFRARGFDGQSDEAVQDHRKLSYQAAHVT